MSTIKVRGESNYDFAVDQFVIKFIIRSNMQSSGEAIESGKKRTEQFLKIMNDELNLKPCDFVMGNFSVRQAYSSIKYTYEKSIILKIRSDLKVVEKIAVLMETMSDIEYVVSFEFIDESEKEQVVLQSAINDSKKKAEIIAASLGKKIIGVEDIDYDCTSGELNFDNNVRHIAKSVSVEDNNDLASQLKNPIKKIHKSINIDWIME